LVDLYTQIGFIMNWQEIIDQLRGTTYQFGVIGTDSPVHRVQFETGLSDAEVAVVENRFGFHFPPDLRAFLQTALPTGPRFPHWRSGDESSLREWLDAPRQGVLFDIEHNGFWLKDWGPRPADLREVCRRSTHSSVSVVLDGQDSTPNK
jgi:hypothetical protein